MVFRFASLALAAAAGLATGAAAQSIPSPFPSDQVVLFRPDVAGTREQPGQQTDGLPLGGFALHPALRVIALLDSNPLNLADGGDTEGFASLEPELFLRSGWSRHALALGGDARLVRFADLSSENSDSWRLSGSGRLDLAGGATAVAQVQGARAIEPRGAGGTNLPDSDPVVYRELRTSLGVEGPDGPLGLSIAAGAIWRRYDDIQLQGGGTQDQSFRDVRILSVTPRVGFAMGPQLALFASGTASFTRGLSEGGSQSRDADGLVLLAGVRGEITPLLVGEVAGGWQRRTYRSPEVRDYDGPELKATLDWYPTPLVSLRLSTAQSFENSGIPSVPGILSRETAVRLYYEVTRQILVSGEVGHVRDRYREIDVTATSLRAAIRGEVRLNRNLVAALIVRLRDRQTSDSDIVGPYSGQTFGLAVEGRL
jgi:hypothetical protein